MSGPFKVGDVVVCVVDPDGQPGWKEPWEPKKNGIYRVCAVFEDGGYGPTVDLEEDPYQTDEAGWAVEWFRHLPRATDEFTATMRACRPIRVGEPA